MAVYLKNDTTRTSLSEKAKKCEKLQKNYLLRTDKKKYATLGKRFSTLRSFVSKLFRAVLRLTSHLFEKNV